MAPVAVPLAVPLAGAVGSGLAAGIGAALRWGPLLLQLLERGGQPADFRRTPVNSPGRSRQLEQLQALIEGARVGVAMPQPPPLPGGPGFGAVGSLLNAALLLRALVAAGGLLNWGGLNQAGQKENRWPYRREPYAWPTGRWNPTGPNRWEWNVVSRVPHIWNQSCQDPPTIPNEISTVDTVAGEVAWVQSMGSDAGPCPGVPNWFDMRVRVVSAEDSEGPGSPSHPDIPATFVRTGGLRSFEVIATVEPGGPPEDWEDFPSLDDLDALNAGAADPDRPLSGPDGPRPLPQLADGDLRAVLPPVPVPDVVPIADPAPFVEDLPSPGPLPVPSNPAPGQVGGTDPAAGTGAAGSVAPGGLAVPVPTVQPLPAYVPRPVPGPTLPEYVPETQPQPQRVTPTRPAIPGTTPRPAPARPGQPFPSVPAEPGIVPTPDPGTDPAFVPGPGPGPAPGVDPATTPGPAPGPAPGPGGVPVPGPPAVPTTPAGPVAVPIPRPVPTTPTDQHIPAPGDAPVTGNGPAPTLVAMAQEMGRQEQKLGRLLQRLGDPTRPPDPLAPLTDASDLAQLLLQLLELLQELDGPGQYAINSPCNTDPASGEQLPGLVASWGDSSGVLPGVVKRLDALAELLQYQKDLPQPICRGPRPTGEWVTVNFEQVSDGLETT